MKKIYVISFCVSLSAALAVSFLFQKYVQAQDISRSFPSVEAFSVSSGRIGFFDRANGKIYIYGDNLDNCVFKGQLVELGKPIETEKGERPGPVQYDNLNKNLLRYKDPNKK